MKHLNNKDFKNLVIQDLQTYNKKDIQYLMDYYNIPHSFNNRLILDELSNKIMNNYFFVNMNSSQNCHNEIEYITQEEWNHDMEPDIQITFETNTGKEITDCYNYSILQKWMSDPENYYANWIQKSKDRPIDNEGYGGKAGNINILKMPDFKYIIGYYKLDKDQQQYYAKPIFHNYRIGNRFSTFGISQTHGQAPGFTVYYLMKDKDEIMDKDALSTIYQLDRRITPELPRISQRTPMNPIQSLQNLLQQYNLSLNHFIGHIGIQIGQLQNLLFIHQNETKLVYGYLNRNNNPHDKAIFIILLELPMRNETNNTNTFIELNLSQLDHAYQVDMKNERNKTDIMIFSYIQSNRSNSSNTILSFHPSSYHTYKAIHEFHIYNQKEHTNLSICPSAFLNLPNKIDVVLENVKMYYKENEKIPVIQYLLMNMYFGVPVFDTNMSIYNELQTLHLSGFHEYKSNTFSNTVAKKIEFDINTLRAFHNGFMEELKLLLQNPEWNEISIHTTTPQFASSMKQSIQQIDNNNIVIHPFQTSLVIYRK